MTESIDIQGITFDITGAVMQVPTPTRFALRKTEWMVNRYRDIAETLDAPNVVELGIDKGGSTAFLKLILNPKRLLAADINPGPIVALDHFLNKFDPDKAVRLSWNTDQSDTEKLTALLDENFGSEPLDFVIDDASHLLGPTRASFDVLFPRLKPGGIFIIEDWSWQQKYERIIADKLAATTGDEYTELSNNLKTHAEQGEEPLLPRLITELVLASGYAPDVVANVYSRTGWCEIVRGPAELDETFHIADHIGASAERLIFTS